MECRDKASPFFKYRKPLMARVRSGEKFKLVLNLALPRKVGVHSGVFTLVLVCEDGAEQQAATELTASVKCILQKPD